MVDDHTKTTNLTRDAVDNFISDHDNQHYTLIQGHYAFYYTQCLVPCIILLGSTPNQLHFSLCNVENVGSF